MKRCETLQFRRRSILSFQVRLAALLNRSRRGCAARFLSVSPLWLRGATAFAASLCRGLFAVSRTWQQPVMNARDNDKKYTEEQFQQAVRKQVEEIGKSSEEKREQVITPANDDAQPQTQFATRRSRPRTQPSNKLTREEREQLAADLGLIPRREEELPFVLPEGEEPNQ